MNGINLLGGTMLVSGIVTIKKGFDRATTENKKGEVTTGKWLKETILDFGLGFAGGMTATVGLFLLCCDATVKTTN